MKKKKTTKIKIPIYFDKVNDAPALAILEHFRVLSKTELPMSKFIKFVAVEYCLMIERQIREQVNKETEESTNEEGQV